MLGARGYVSQGVSAGPRQSVQIVRWLQAGAYEKAMKWIRVMEHGYTGLVIQAIRAGYCGEGNYIKAAMNAAGFPCGPARLPNRPMPAQMRERFEAWMERVSALEV
jgi:dihydrodipicolinate synthase/N-acetylneuraminate lyase